MVFAVDYHPRKLNPQIIQIGLELILMFCLGATFRALPKSQSIKNSYQVIKLLSLSQESLSTLLESRSATSAI